MVFHDSRGAGLASAAAHPDVQKGALVDRRCWLVAFGLVAACLLVYAQTAHFQFVNYDDEAYVTQNPWVPAGLTKPGLVWAFTTVDYFYWQPLTWVSLMVDTQFFGAAPGPAHVHNVVLHILNA